MRVIFIPGSTLIDVVVKAHVKQSDEEFQQKYDDGIMQRVIGIA